MDTYIAGETSYLIATTEQGKEYRLNTCSVADKLCEGVSITMQLITDGDDISSTLGETLSLSWYQDVAGRPNKLLDYNAYVVEVAEQEANADSIRAFNIRLESWLWLLRFSRTYRIYQAQTVKDILSDIFDNAGFKGMYKFGSMPSTKKEYCTQYDETDLEFVTRIIAEAGVVFFFSQSDGKHTLELQLASAPFDDNKSAKFDHSLVKSAKNLLIQSWQPEQRLAKKSLSLSGYNYAKAKSEIGSAQQSSSNVTTVANSSFEHFALNSDAGDFTDVSTLATQLNNAQEAQASNIRMTTDANVVLVGNMLSVESHVNTQQQGQYNTLAVEHQIDVTQANVGTSYVCHVTCRDSALALTPMSVEKPAVRGITSALVVTDTGSFDSKGEINQDKDGRIKVHFMWDVSDAKSTSCYLRVMQQTAGSNAGMQFIPRIGDEVLVDFINGDIDQPIVIGSVYNSGVQPPYAQKDATQSSIKTGLAEDTGHEICFDDKKGEEKLSISSGKDLDITVTNNATTLVNAEDVLTIKKSQKTTIEESQTVAVTKNYSLKADKIAIEGESEIELKVGSNKITISSSGIKIEASNIELKSSQDTKISALNLTTSSSASTKISATANVDIKATAQANLEGTAGANVKSTAIAKLEGTAGAQVTSTAMAKLSGAAMAEITGALVKIN
ncbi:type VI secretion system tip protein VgrG [Pseudoalteromonas citrea]|uniref:Type VI secretion system tip protein VgrG n=1 Tax=Pseudoalteromonas citrea TaxID=43655 RepID=A0A5S3XSZ9_9GAMM|nr:type VI secretion system tip protein TssI/VgrG [Pseudoalteromonas citrea]TMP45152.1 type VI secretion system tip protein VgrG [Pseudoalteromonas citrea]TMP61467.1 type VI secretion system tip protein VgrG [Pseudoalteromonas citrea]